VELKKLTDYGIVIIAIGIGLAWLGYPGDFLITLGLLAVFIGVMMRLGRTKQK
jgi:hypothetical protein